MNTDDFTDTLDLHFRDRLRSARTNIPCKVVKVDYTLDRVDCQPLTKTLYKNGTQLATANLISVPLMVYSANAGDARITMPIQIGDTVLVLCSDRDYGDMLLRGDRSDCEDIAPMGLYPIMAIPCFLPENNAKAVNRDNIEIHNGSTSIKIAPDGSISLSTDTSVDIQCNTAVVNAEGSVSVTSPSSTFNGNVSITGMLDVNGNIISTTGNIAATAGDVIATSTSLKTHIHSGGVIPPDALTGPPTA